MESEDLVAEQLLCRVVRHRETLRHSMATRDFAYALATHCGYDHGRASAIARAALLHDIGKCEIPATILDAPRELTPGEWKLVQRHPRRGAEIALEAGISEEVCSWIGLHHERLDGKGYYGVRELPPEVRVLIVADVWEACGALRAYSTRYVSRQERWAILARLGFDREVFAFRSLLECAEIADAG